MEDKWFRDGTPVSYKIQLGYVEIPKHLKLKEQIVDTPYRFSNFVEAQEAAKELFNGYSYKIVGSNDAVHWQAKDGLPAIHGEKASYRTKYDEKAYQDLRKLRDPRSPMIKQKESQQPQQRQQPETRGTNQQRQQPKNQQK